MSRMDALLIDICFSLLAHRVASLAQKVEQLKSEVLPKGETPREFLNEVESFLILLISINRLLNLVLIKFIRNEEGL